MSDIGDFTEFYTADGDLWGVFRKGHSDRDLFLAEFYAVYPSTAAEFEDERGGGLHRGDVDHAFMVYRPRHSGDGCAWHYCAGTVVGAEAITVIRPDRFRGE